MFVEYPKKIKGYYFYLTEEQKMFVSNRTIFLEKEFFAEETNVTKIKLSKVCEVKISINIKLDLIGESNPELVEMSLKRSDRVPHQSDRYYNFLV